MTRNFLRSACIFAALVAALAVASSASAARIAWLSVHAADNTPSAPAAAVGYTTAPDKGYTDLLTSAGHIVTRDLVNATFDTAQLAGNDVVIYSRSNASGNYQTDVQTAKWNSLNIPSISLNAFLNRTNRLGFHSGNTTQDAAGDIRLRAANKAHPIFQGIVFDANNLMVNPYAGIVTFTTPDPDLVQRGVSVVTEAPNPGGQILATVGASSAAVDPTLNAMMIGFWPKGATMVNDGADDVLGERRLVIYTGSREAAAGSSPDAAGMFDLTPTGAHLFLNAVTFLQNVPEPSTAGLAALAIAACGMFRRRAR